MILLFQWRDWHPQAGPCGSMPGDAVAGPVDESLYHKARSGTCP